MRTCDCVLENGYYINSTTTNNDEKCVKCNESCKTCDGPTDQGCTFCTIGFFMLDPIETSKTCKKECLPGTFASDLQLAVCLKCDDELCLECVGTNSTCTKCHPPSDTRSHTWLYSNECLNQCPDGF